MLDDAERMLIDRVAVIGVELQAGPRACVMPGMICSSTRSSCSRRKQFAQPRRLRQERQEPLGDLLRQRLIGIGRAALHHRRADRLPGVVVDPLVREVRQVEQPQHFGQIALQLGQPARRGRDRRRADAKVAFELVAEERLDEPAPARAAGGPRRQSATAISRTSRGVLEVVAHELLDRQAGPRPAG